MPVIKTFALLVCVVLLSTSYHAEANLNDDLKFAQLYESALTGDAADAAVRNVYNWNRGRNPESVNSVSSWNRGPVEPDIKLSTNALLDLDSVRSELSDEHETSSLSSQETTNEQEKSRKTIPTETLCDKGTILCRASKRRWGQYSVRAWGKRRQTRTVIEPINVAQLEHSEVAEIPTPERQNGVPLDPSLADDIFAPSLTLDVQDSVYEANPARQDDPQQQPSTKNVRLTAQDRQFADIQIQPDVHKDGLAAGVKRKWGGKSVSAWGKRDKISEEEKRKWGGKSVSAWGKRDELSRPDEKRKWGGKSVSAWGKRSENFEEAKRRWGDKSVSAWGKRNSDTKLMKTTLLS